MRRKALRVAFLGVPDRQFAGLVAQLSPAICATCVPRWDDLGSGEPESRPELVVPWPGETLRPPAAGAFPCWTPSEADWSLPPEEFEARLLSQSLVPPGSPSRLLGHSPAMVRFRADLASLARTDLPLLLSGENGTGKDLAATEAHGLSSRAAGPLVAVNCGAIPPSLAETEFFGCVRGAFTGAENRSGFCQQALGGTLFLDEVAELPSEIQAKLLRALENQEVRRVGSGKVETIDFRLICATNKDLGAEVAAGRFREDLYYRINVLPLRMPALRERTEDIALLAHHFLRTEVLPRAVQVSRKALAKMADYPWPGNLRQLRNVVLRAAVLHRVAELEPEHIAWDC